MPEDREVEAKRHIPTNLRLLLLLEEIARAGEPVAPSALCDLLGLPKPTVHRLLNTAELEGFLQRDIDGRSYGLGRRTRRLSINTLSSPSICTDRLRVMKALSAEIGETCNLAAPAYDGMVYQDCVDTHWALRVQLPVGKVVPFHCTASGKMYLSLLGREKRDRLLSSLTLKRYTDQTLTDPEALCHDLLKTQARGYSIDNEEFMEGVTAVAVPIFDDRDRLLTTLSIHVPKQRCDLDELVHYLSDLRNTASKLEELALE